jgi:hypothetical protein
MWFCSQGIGEFALFWAERQSGPSPATNHVFSEMRLYLHGVQDIFCMLANAPSEVPFAVRAL